MAAVHTGQTLTADHADLQMNCIVAMSGKVSQCDPDCTVTKRRACGGVCADSRWIVVVGSCNQPGPEDFEEAE